jgi:hypothetical protein
VRLGVHFRGEQRWLFLPHQSPKFFNLRIFTFELWDVNEAVMKIRQKSPFMVTVSEFVRKMISRWTSCDGLTKLLPLILFGIKIGAGRIVILLILISIHHPEGHPNDGCINRSSTRALHALFRRNVGAILLLWHAGIACTLHDAGFP